MPMIVKEVSWKCCDEKTYDHAGMLAHLKEVHGITPPIHSKRSNVMCMDGSGWAVNIYLHEVGDIQLTQTVKSTEAEEQEDGA